MTKLKGCNLYLFSLKKKKRKKRERDFNMFFTFNKTYGWKGWSNANLEDQNDKNKTYNTKMTIDQT